MVAAFGADESDVFPDQGGGGGVRLGGAIELADGVLDQHVRRDGGHFFKMGDAAAGRFVAMDAGVNVE